MPSTYAHYCFGKAVYRRLPQEIQEEIKAYSPLYMTGLHGPDILFYYKPLKSTGAKLYTYILDNFEEIDSNRTRPLVLICLGGGYEFTSDREAEAVAVQYIARGFHACVLRYSVAPAEFPQSLCELMSLR